MQNETTTVKPDEPIGETLLLLQARVEHEPTSADAYAALGKALASRNKHVEAVAALEAACRLDPADPDSLAALSASYLSIGRATDAIQRLKQAVELAPKNAKYWINLRHAYWAAGDIRPANAAGREAVRLGASSGEHSNLILGLHYEEGVAPELIYSENSTVGRASRFDGP